MRLFPVGEKIVLTFDSGLEQRVSADAAAM